MSFSGAGQSAGLEIWRIEDFEAVPYDKASYGKFYVGDSYIVLSTTGKGPLTWNIHFWQGNETSLDESGTAAIKSVELDEELGGRPVQHREVQDHESSLFLSYFKSGVKYLPGGVKSGFSHVDPADDEKRLFRVKGKRNIKVKQVPLDASSMNKSDCFILDCGKTKDLLVYCPSGARRVEKFKASQAALEIKNEDHAGHGNVEIIDEYQGDQAKFFEELGSGSPDSIPDSSPEDDEEAEKADNQEVTLYQVSGDDGSLDVTVVSGKPLKQDMLKSGDCFILLTGSTSGIIVWIGKEASKEERIQAMKSGEAFLAKFNLPKWTKIERIVDGGETATFKQYFQTWREPEDSPSAGLRRVYPAGTITEWDMSSLHADDRRRIAKSGGDAVGFMPDNATGKKEIFRVQDFDLVPLGVDVYGKFFGGDSYVVKYSYEKDGGRPGYIIYFWQGGESSQDEKSVAAMSAVKMDNELDGKAVQVRVVQGREPRHFIKMFNGKLVVFTGGKASGFRNVHDSDFYDADGTRMFCVRGTGLDDIRAVQVAEVAASLNSEDVFVLETPAKTFVWTGNCSTEDELASALRILDVVSPGRPHEIVVEGSEPEDFWNGLGGLGDYSKCPGNLDRPVLEPRLFHCRVVGDKMVASEVHNFEKDDLVSDDVMLLDSGDEVYVWIGNEASADEKEKSLQFARDYLAADPTDRDEKNSLVFVVKEGEEPSSFTCVFPSF